MDPVAIPFPPIGIEDDRPQFRFLSELMLYLEGFWPKLANRVNAMLPKDGSEAMTGPAVLSTYTIATLPTASEHTGKLIYVSDGLAFSGAMMSKSVVESVPTATNHPLIWQTERYDEGDWFGSSGDNFFTVPVGVTRVRVSGSVHGSGVGGGTYRVIAFWVNGASVPGSSSGRWEPTVFHFDNHHSAVIDVVAGDTITMEYVQDTGVNQNVNATNPTSFAVEAKSWYSNVMVSDGSNWVNF